MDYFTFYNKQTKTFFTEAKPIWSHSAAHRFPSVAATQSSSTDHSGSVDTHSNANTHHSTGDLAIDSYDFDTLHARSDLAFDVRTMKAYSQRFNALAQQQAETRTQEILTKRRNAALSRRAAKLEQRTAGAHTESAVNGEMIDGGAGIADEHINVTDHVGDQVAHTKVGTSLHKTHDGVETEHSLATFFERPFSIYDAAWNPDTEYSIALKVWDLWSRKPAVRAKLSNYAYFRGKLHLKIAVSGTPFHYGRLLASYQPYADYNESLITYDFMHTASTYPDIANTRILYKAYLSQAPGAKTMDVKDNKPLEIEIPFISYKQKYRLFNNSNLVITNDIPFHDFAEAGQLRLVTLNPFKVANADHSCPVSINVFAWCTEVELGTTTGTNIDISAESKLIETEAKRVSKKKRAPRHESSDDDSDDSYGGRFHREEEERQARWSRSKKDKPMYSGKGNFGSRLMDSLEKGGDEYAEPGPVTKVATAVASAGESLSDVPVIGGFAKATSTIAKSVGRVASWFGWSKPELLDNPVFVKNQPFQNGAVLTGHQTEYKIACDPKNELTVDPSIGGVDGDDMAIAKLCATKSYIGSFLWKDTDVAMTDVLWKTGVSPMLGVFLRDMPGTLDGNTHYYQDSALAFAARPFNYWRGNIKLTFEVVCSKFHRGKLLFRYEPNSAQYHLIASSPAQLNQQNTTILDIQNGQTITFDIDWTNCRSWCLVPEISNDRWIGQYSNDLRGSTTVPYIPLANGDFDASELNGVFEVRVLNELVQPTTLSDVTINVYAWSDDISFACPTVKRIPLNRSITTESNLIGVQPVVQDDSEENIVSNEASMDKIHLDHFGEKILSFRALAKRFTTVAYFENGRVEDGPRIIYYQQDNIPLPENGPKNTVYTKSTRYEERTILAYMRWSYMGLRGSMKHRLRIFGDTLPDAHDYTNVRLLAPHNLIYNFPTIGDLSTDVQDLVNGFDNDPATQTVACSAANMLEGAVNFHHYSNGGIEFVTPYYNHNLFQFSFCNNPTGYSTDQVGGYSPVYQSMYSACFATRCTGGKATIMEDIAIGEDFTFFRFQGAAPFGSKPIYGS